MIQLSNPFLCISLPLKFLMNEFFIIHLLPGFHLYNTKISLIHLSSFDFIFKEVVFVFHWSSLFYLGILAYNWILLDEFLDFFLNLLRVAIDLREVHIGSLCEVQPWNTNRSQYVYSAGL